MLVQAEGGICAVTGTPEEQCRIGVSACDVATGMFAHAAVLQALYEREKTGKGNAVKASLFSSMADWMAGPLLHHDYANRPWPRIAPAPPLLVPLGAFPTQGGAQTPIPLPN